MRLSVGRVCVYSLAHPALLKSINLRMYIAFIASCHTWNCLTFPKLEPARAGLKFNFEGNSVGEFPFPGHARAGQNY